MNRLSYPEVTFVLLTPDTAIDFSDFDCGDADLNDFLKSDALRDSRNYFSSTHLAIYKGEVIGFFSLVTDTIHLKQNLRDSFDIDYPYGKLIPALKIGRLARSMKYRGYGVGKILMTKIIHIACETAKKVSFRVISVDAKNTEDAFRLYRECGFVQGPSRPEHEQRFILMLRLYLMS